LGKRFVYELKVLLGYQIIMDPKGIQTIEGKRIKRNKRLYGNGKWSYAS
jgi:hypothetical protein